MPEYVVNYSGYGVVYVEAVDEEAAHDAFTREKPDNFKVQEIDIDEVV